MPFTARPSCSRKVLARSVVLASGLAYGAGVAAQLEEVIVTARKTEEGLQQVPVAVSAFSRETLQEAGLQTLTTISTSTPNLQLQRDAGGDSSLLACMRGMCRSDSILTEEPMVGTYVDGFYLPQALGAYFNLLDIQRVEVLRGPQGTLFGKNTVGGAVSVTTVRPSNEFSGEATGTVGNESLYAGKISVNLPITDSLYTRLSYAQEERDGMIENKGRGVSDLDDRDYQAARIAVAWDATDDFQVDYVFDYYDAEQAPNTWQLTDAGPGLDFVFPGITGFADKDYQDEVETIEDPFDDLEVTFNGLTLNWNLGTVVGIDDFTIKSLTGYRETESDSYRASLPYYFITGKKNQEVDFFTQEFQFLGTAMDGRLNIVSGLFYSDLDGDLSLDQEFGAPIPAAVINLETDTETWAIYAELTYDITEKWSASLGGRYTDEQKEVTSVLGVPQAGISVPISDLAPEDEFDTDNFSPRVSVSYQATDDVMLYATYSKGFKSGGLNGRATSPLDFNVYDDAEADSFELGMKSDLLGNRLRLNLAAFYQELDDWQVQVNSIDPDLGVFLSRIENASEANMTGVEAEATWVVTDSFQLSGSVGWIDTEYDSFESFDPLTGQQVDVSDIYEFQFAPEWSYNVTARYETDIGDLGSLMARVDYAWVDEQYFQTRPSERIEGDSYDLVDGRIELRRIAGSGFTVGVWGKNLTDEEYRTGGFDVPTFGITFPPLPDGMYANSWGTPRTYGVDVRYEWGP